MSEYRDSLSPDARAHFDQAIARAGAILAAARRDRDELAAQRGPLAVGLAAAVPGGPAPQEIADLYVSLRDSCLSPASFPA